MCGRFFLGVEPIELNNILNEKYSIDKDNSFYLPKYNISPGQLLIAVINDGSKNRVGTIKWGYIPSWAKDDKFKIINAKSETLSNKPSFKNSYQNKRCVILAEGFYEWKKEANKKIPYVFKLKNKRVFSMAGLWSKYLKEDGQTLYTCTIITTKPNDLVKDFHDRMPVILSDEDESLWLDTSIKDTKDLDFLLKPYDANKMLAYRVSSKVNNVRNDSKECIVPL